MSRTISQRRRSRKSCSRPAPVTRTTAVNTAGSAPVLEGEREPRAELHHFAALDLHVELGDLGDAQVAQGFRRGLHGDARRVLPRIGARADDVGDPVDGARSFAGHDSLLLVGAGFSAGPFYTR